MQVQFRQEALSELLGDLKKDYRGFLIRANKHRIIQLLDFSSLRNKDIVELDAVEKEVNRIKVHCFAYYQLRGKNFISLSKMLSGANVDYLMVKGLDVATRYYEKPWLRSFGDTDILIRGSQLDKIYKQFTENEFIVERLDLKNLSQGEIKKILQNCSKINEPVTFNCLANCIDVHPIDDVRFDALIESSIQREIFDQKYLALAEEDNLVFLLKHGQKHNWHTIQWIVDVFLIIEKRSEFELLELYKYCETCNVSRSFEICMLLSNYLFNFKISPVILREIPALSHNSALFEIIKIQLTSDDESFKRKIFNLKTQILFEPKFFGKSITFSRKVFSPTLTDFNWVVLPKGLRFLYYIIRPIRGFWGFLRLKIDH